MLTIIVLGMINDHFFKNHIFVINACSKVFGLEEISNFKIYLSLLIFEKTAN